MNMNWLHFSLLTIALYGVHDITLKHLAGAVQSTIASILINGSACLALLVYFLLQKATVKPAASLAVGPGNAVFLILAGASLGLATITFMNAFARDGALSIAVPVVYAGVIVLCLFTGILFYGESLHWKQGAGALLAIGGIYLMSATN